MKRLINYFVYLINKIKNIVGLGKAHFRNEKSIQGKFDSYSFQHECIALDVGSGPTPKNPFKAPIVYGADLRENKANNVIHADLAFGILPFGNESFDYITAYDVLEHIQRVAILNGETRFPFIHLMNEIFRVLKIGGVFFNLQPCFPSKEAFQDPTHVNIMTEDTLHLYFCESAWARIYGYEGSFVMLEDGWIGGKYFSFMKKTSGNPVRDLNFVQK